MVKYNKNENIKQKYLINCPLQWQHPLLEIAGMVLYIDESQSCISKNRVINWVWRVTISWNIGECNSSETLRKEVEILRTCCRYFRGTRELLYRCQLIEGEVCCYAGHDFLWSRIARPVCSICPHQGSFTIELTLQRKYGYRCSDSKLYFELIMCEILEK